MNRVCFYDSPLGKILLESDGAALTGLYFEGTKNFEYCAGAFETEDLSVFFSAKRWLDVYFSGKNPEFAPPLKLCGSKFAVLVWEFLLEIPYGSVTTYGKIARRAARKAGVTKISARAVGGAVGRNPVSIIVPCHRVIGSNGNLTGYAGGLDKKIGLLQIEKTDMSKMFLSVR